MRLLRPDSPFAGFLLVGGCGFLTDSVVFQSAMMAGWGVVASRSLSATLAISLTWFLNRRFVFRTSGVNSRGPEYARYVGVQVAGLIVNLSVFFGLLAWVPALRPVPLIALAAGAAVAIAFNYLGARYWAYAVAAGDSPHG